MEWNGMEWNGIATRILACTVHNTESSYKNDIKCMSSVGITVIVGQGIVVICIYSKMLYKTYRLLPEQRKQKFNIQKASIPLKLKICTAAWGDTFFENEISLIERAASLE